MLEPLYIADLVAQAARERAREAGLEVQIEHPSGRFYPPVSITIGDQTFDFHLSITPFNPKSATDIIDDKWLFFQQAGRDLNIPYSQAFVKNEADADSIYKRTLASIEDEAHPFAFPIVVKPSHGSKSVNVCICHDEEELRAGIEMVSKDASHGAHIVVQQHVQAKAEYRAVFFQGEIVFVYEKNPNHIEPGEAVVLGQNASPDFWQGAGIGEVKDETLIERFKPIGQHVYQEYGAVYMGFDIIVDEHDDIWVIECNSSPLGLASVNKVFENGRKIVHGLAAKMLDRMIGLAEPSQERTQDLQFEADPKVA